MDRSPSRLTRRALLAGLISAPSVMLPENSQASGLYAPKLRALLVGTRPELLPPAILSGKDRASVLVGLDLNSGEQTAVPIDVPDGANVLALLDGRMLFVGRDAALLLNTSGSIVHKSVAPPGFHFTGGAYANQSQAILTLTRDVSGANDESGLLRRIVLQGNVSDLPDLTSFGVDPNSLSFMAETNEFAVLHSGVLPNSRFKTAGQAYHPVAPMITVLDGDTLALKRHISLGHISGKPSSMALLAPNLAVVGLTQFQWLPSQEDEGIVASLTAPVQLTALFQGQAAVSQPLLRVSLRDGGVDALIEGRGHAAIARNEVTGVLAATFSDSDYVALVSVDGNVKNIDSSELGLTNVSGVSDVPGTSYVCLAGAHRYLVVFDLRSLTVVRRYRTENFGAARIAVASQA